MSSAFPLLLIAAAMVCVILGIVVILIAGARKRSDVVLPRCGHCGYNLTGATANRCPECGHLFIEAGVITGQHPAAASRGAKRIVWTLVIGLTLLAGLGTSFMVLRSSVLRAQAIAVQQAALQAQQRALAAKQQATATAPADDGSQVDSGADEP